MSLRFRHWNFPIIESLQAASGFGRGTNKIPHESNKNRAVKVAPKYKYLKGCIKMLTDCPSFLETIL